MRTLFHKYLFIFLSVITLGGHHLISALEYEIVDLGTLETDKSRAFCINDRNQICGDYFFQGEQHFFLWGPENGPSCLYLPKGAQPIRMNNVGQIIGQFNAGNNKLYGFFWDPVTGFADIGTLGGEMTWVTDINDYGQVVGYSKTGSGINSERHAFIWENGSIKDLGTLCGDLCLHGNDSGAMGINNDGVIVGFSNQAILHKGKKLMSPHKAVLWENGQIHQLNIPNSELYYTSQACAVNNLMQVLYIHNNKCYLRDIPSGNDFDLRYRRLENSKLTDSDAILNLHWVMLDCTNKNSKDHGTSAKAVTKNSIWKSINCHSDVNNAKWIVGIATTIYGEEHAILLRPKN